MGFITDFKFERFNAPIIFFQCYLSFTVLLFFFGPWDWEIDNQFVLLLYLIGSQFFLYLGYQFGLRNYKQRSCRNIPFKLIKVSIFLNLIISLPLIYVRSGGNFSFIFMGFSDPGLVYSLSRDSTLSYNITEYINIIISPITWSLIPWLMYYWKRVSRRIKIWGIVAIFFGTILPYVVSGTNKGLFDILFIFIGIIVLPLLSKKGFLNFFTGIKSLKYLGFLISFFLLLFFYFSSNIEQRLGGNKDFLERIAVNVRAENAHVSEKFLSSSLPENVKGGIIALSSYISQGYYGCSLAMKEVYVPTYGLGNSRFLSWLVGDLVLGQDFQMYTYPKRVSDKTSWDYNIVWSSIYPWFASDFTFLGTYFIVFLVGNLLAKSWIGMLAEHDPWSITLFSLLCIMLFYFSANNQIFQTGTTFVTFFVSLFLWRFKIKA